MPITKTAKAPKKANYPTATAIEPNAESPEGLFGICGNVGDDPILRVTPGGTKVTNFSVAYMPYDPETRKRAEEPTWWRVVTFGRLAEKVAENVEKGERVSVVGRLQYREYEGTNGTEGRWELIAEDVAGSYLWVE